MSARETSSVIERMADEVTQTTEANHKISDVSKEQKDKIQFLQASLDRLFDTFQESSTKVETTATIGDDLYHVSESMNDLLSKFSFERDNVNEPEAEEKRRSPRVNHHLRVHLKQNGKELESISRDFSMTGMQLWVKEALDKNRPLHIDIFIPHESLDQYEKQTPLSITARIAWQKNKEDGYAVGVDFGQLDEVQKSRLKSCFGYFNKPSEFAKAG